MNWRKIMNITNVNDETYLAAISQLQAANAQQSGTQTGKTSTGSDFDSYISAITDSGAAIPSSTYGANGLETETFSPVTDTNTDSDVSTEEGSAVSGASGGGGGDSSDSDDETTTEIVTINGVTYLVTTTTDENGNETVTRTKLSDSSESSSASASAATSAL
jgi:hypothetical protein